MRSREQLSRRVVLAGGGLAMMLGGLYLFRERRQEEPDAGRRRAGDVAQQQGVRIVLYGLSPDHENGLAARLPDLLGGAVTAVEPGALSWALDGMEQALGVYPHGFYGRHCTTLFVCGSLTLDGRPAGGACVAGNDWIVLAAPMERGRDTVEMTCRLGIHHEFSSIVWSRTLTLPGRWEALVPPGWASAESNRVALDVADDPPPPPTTGFLSAYGATTLENDFNTYAEQIFTEPARLLELAQGHHLIAAKLALVLDTYIDLDSRMGGVFSRLGLGPLIGASRGLAPGGTGHPPLRIPAGQLVQPE